MSTNTGITYNEETAVTHTHTAFKQNSESAATASGAGTQSMSTVNTCRHGNQHRETTHVHNDPSVVSNKAHSAAINRGETQPLFFLKVSFAQCLQYSKI